MEQTPKSSTLQEILQMADDQIVYSVKAVLEGSTKYFPPKPEDPQSQSFQVITLRQGNTKLKAICRNRDEIPQAWNGKTLFMTAYHGDKGWFGLKAKDNTYKKQGEEIQERILMITKTAEIVPVAPQAAEASQGSQHTSRPQKAAPGASQGASRGSLAASDLEDLKHVQNARVYLAKSANAYILAAQAANHVVESLAKSGIALHEEAFQGLCTTFFLNISGNFNTRPDLVQGMPVKPVLDLIAAAKGESAPPPPPPEPEPEPEPEPDPAYEEDPDDDDVPF